MFDGRHCSKDDLALLLKETNRVKLSISQQVEDVDRYIKRYLDFIKIFDQEIADKMTRLIKTTNGDLQKIEKIIDDNIEILERNVVVDIYEHK